MTVGRYSIVFLCILVLSFFIGVENVKRNKRELRFPKGTTFWTAVALNTILPKGLTDGFVHVLEFDLGFPFPQELAIDRIDVGKKPYFSPYKPMMTKTGVSKYKHFKKYRTKRNLMEEQRRDLIYKIEDAISRVGYNGSSCVSRFQCELRNISPENSFLEELLTALFKTSSQLDVRECEDSISNCPVSLLHAILHSEQMPKV